MNKCVFKCRLNVSVELQRRTVSGNELQTHDAATENARRPMFVFVLGTVSRGAWDDRRCPTGSAMLVRSLGYAGVDVARTLSVRTAIFYVMRCLTGRQCSERRSGLASDRPLHWQTTLARLFCVRYNLFSVSAGAPYSGELQ